MIKLTDVGKTYVSKSKNRVEALRGVSLDLGENGMTFILGKSGSGKSTLLNLLGGLDRPTFGSIQVDGADMSSFTQTDYDDYRNRYVGFVFQEYNLLDDFNVKDNVALALRFASEVNVEEKVTQALEQVELGEQYLTRRVGELSGGEKQRVAIARAIIKDSKMILADEPTGNLDSETGESIWAILKRLSADRPVIVVSHDRDSAEQYADRIIKISDGKVVEDNGGEQPKQSERATEAANAEQTESTEPQEQSLAKQREGRARKLSFAVKLKMAGNSLLKHKARSVTVALISAFILCVLLISQLIITVLPERSAAKYLRRNHSPYVTVAQGYEGDRNDLYTPREIYRNGERYRKASTVAYLEQNAQTLDWGFVDGKQELTNFGFTFVGEAQEIDERSFYVTKSYVDEMIADVYNLENKVIVNGNTRTFPTIDFPYEQLVGCQAKILLMDDYYRIAGIIDDDSINVELPRVFTAESFVGTYYMQVMGLSVNSKENKDVVIKANGIEGDYSLGIDYRGYGLDDVVTAEGKQPLQEITLNNDEVILSFDLFIRLFCNGDSSEYVTVNDFGRKILIKNPDVMGQKIKFEFCDCETQENVVSTEEMTIRGVCMPSESSYQDEFFVCSVPQYYSLARRLNRSGTIVKVDSVKHLLPFLVNLRTKHMGYVLNVGFAEEVGGGKANVADGMYYMETLHDYSIILIVIVAILAVTTLLLLVSLVSFSISRRKKEIGILSALGVSSQDISGIFLLETAVIALAVIVMTFVCLLVALGIFNLVFSKLLGFVSALPLFVVDVYAVLTLLGVCCVLFPLFALIPSMRIAKLKPIDAIRVL